MSAESGSPNKKHQRQLSAIMFTDMVGYSRLSQENESLALELLTEHRKILRDIIARHAGREIETAGDAFFVEFLSAVDAAECAIEIQSRLNERNQQAETEKHIIIRIGLHIGDVVHMDDKVHGDGVNIAARFEPLATPGGIALSEDFARAVQNKLQYPVCNRGSVSLKNIAEPMNLFCVELPWLTEKILTTEDTEEKSFGKKFKWPVLVPVTVVLTISLFFLLTDFPIITGEQSKTSRLAVMPFALIGGDSTDQYFADGMTEQIISSLSNLSGLSVIARSSVQKFIDNNGKMESLSSELNVGNYLEGSIRKYLNKARISVRLIDAVKQENVWVRDYDRELRDIFIIQAEIAQNIASELQVTIGRQEKERLENKNHVNSESFNAYLLGRFHLKRRTTEDVKRSVNYFEQAIQLDSTFALAYTGLADAYTLIGAAGYGEMGAEVAITNARENAIKALKLDENLSEAHTSLAYIKFRIEWDFDGAEMDFKRAIELSPSNAQAHEWYALYLALRGRFTEALERMKFAAGLNPLSPGVKNGIGRIYYFMGEYDKAIAQYKSILASDPGYAESHFSLGLTYCLVKDYEKSITELEKAVELSSRRPVILANLGHAYARSGNEKKVNEILKELTDRSRSEYIPPFCYMTIYGGLGDLDRFFELFNQGVAEKDGILLYMKADPLFDEGVGKDPRYLSVLEKIGL